MSFDEIVHQLSWVVLFMSTVSILKAIGIRSKKPEKETVTESKYRLVDVTSIYSKLIIDSTKYVYTPLFIRITYDIQMRNLEGDFSCCGYSNLYLCNKRRFLDHIAGLTSTSSIPLSCQQMPLPSIPGCGDRTLALIRKREMI